MISVARYLSNYFEASGREDVYALMEASANAAWNLARNVEDNDFSVSWIGPATRTPRLSLSAPP